MIVKFTGEQIIEKHYFSKIADEWAAEAFPKLAYRTLSCYTAGLKHAMYSDYCTVNQEYSENIKNEYHDIMVLSGDKIRRLGAIAKNKLTVGMFD